MSGQRKFHATITTRYGLPEKNIYEQVIDLVKKENIAKSRAQLLLVERGLQHTNNPQPLVKEKVVYRDRPGKTIEKVVYKDKVVYRDKESIPSKHLGIQEHIGVDDHITEQPASKGQAQDSGQGKSTPNTALGVKKSLKEEKGISGWAIGGGLGIVGLLLYLLFR